MKSYSDEKKVALLVSLFTNPALILFITLFFANIDLIAASVTEAFIFSFIGLVLPLGVYFYELSKHGKKAFEHISISRKDREKIYLVLIFSFLLNVLLFTSPGSNPYWIYNGMILTILFSSFYLINKYIDKLSVHTGIYTFSIIYLADKIHIAFALLLIFLPFVCWSRIYLNKHSWLQLMLGSAIGMFIGLLSWVY